MKPLLARSLPLGAPDLSGDAPTAILPALSALRRANRRRDVETAMEAVPEHLHCSIVDHCTRRGLLSRGTTQDLIEFVGLKAIGAQLGRHVATSIEDRFLAGDSLPRGNL